MGSTWYSGKEFHYLECQACYSLFCDPVPDAATLAEMYGVGYQTAFDGNICIDDSKEPARVVEWLRARSAGTFIDFGCGTGDLLVAAARAGWSVKGVEFSEEVAVATSKRTGVPVVSVAEALRFPGEADVIHLGDVIEHLTDVDLQLGEALSLVKPGGWLIAQGPLECGPTLFTEFIKVTRRISRRTPINMPPYHVIQATIGGQRALFQRFSLLEDTYSISEVAWPAPARISLPVLRQPRALILWALRRVSVAATAFSGGRLGNRYFYAGRVLPPGDEP